MKKCIFSLVVTVLVTQLAFSQKVEVIESTCEFSSGSNNALGITILKSDAKTVQKAWEKLMKNYGAKVKSKKEIFADDASIKSISDNTVDIYATVNQERKSEDVHLKVAFDLGGAYLSSSQHPDKYKAAEKIMQDFALELIADSYTNVISDKEKELDKMIRNRDKVKNDKEHLEKQNKDYADRIEKNKKEIEKREKELEEKNVEIEEKNKEIENIKNEAKKIK